jgi:hypothetical protein
LAKSEGLGKAFHANGSKIAILISDKVYFQSKLVRSKEGHYNVIKRKLIHQEDIIINICISNISVQKQTLTTERRNTWPYGNRRVQCPTSNNRSDKIRNIGLRKHRIQLDLTDISRTFQQW